MSPFLLFFFLSAPPVAYDFTVIDSLIATNSVTQDYSPSKLLIASRASIATYIGGQFTDGFVSAYGFGAKKLIELNKLLSWAQDMPVTFAIIKVTVAGVVSYILIRLSKEHPLAVLLTGVALTTVQGYVTYRNYREMRK